MPPLFRKFSRLLAVAGLTVLWPVAGQAQEHAGQEEAAGVVRISDGSSAPEPEGVVPAGHRHQSDCPECDDVATWDNGYAPGYEYNPMGHRTKSFRSRCRQTSASWHGYHDRYYVNGACDDAFVARNHANSLALHQYLLCKFGYFVPTGGGGAGVPPVGHYGRVYAVSPQYHDARDGQVFAAQGYGVPLAVPLAPVVAHTYNYGWGIPSSRLTPISHVAPY